MNDLSLPREVHQPARYEFIVSWVSTSLLPRARMPLRTAIDVGPALG